MHTVPRHSFRQVLTDIENLKKQKPEKPQKIHDLTNYEIPVMFLQEHAYVQHISK